jgi:hypothetical protein
VHSRDALVVGPSVGLLVGSPDGALVGDEDGADEGRSVGESEGLEVGLRVSQSKHLIGHSDLRAELSIHTT